MPFPNNLFLFFVPPLLWNVLFTARLPYRRYFSLEVPAWLSMAEWVGRLCAMAYALLSGYDPQGDAFTIGLIIYLVGLGLYVGTWTLLMVMPVARLDRVVWLTFAPALTPYVWLLGMAILGESVPFGIIATVFIIFHLLEHALRFRMPDE